MFNLIARRNDRIRVRATLKSHGTTFKSLGLLIGVGALFGLLWLGQLATTSMTGALPPDLVKAGISSNPVYALDLAFFLPLCLIAGVGLIRRKGRPASPLRC